MVHAFIFLFCLINVTPNINNNILYKIGEKMFDYILGVFFVLLLLKLRYIQVTCTAFKCMLQWVLTNVYIHINIMPITIYNIVITIKTSLMLPSCQYSPSNDNQCLYFYHYILILTFPEFHISKVKYVFFHDRLLLFTMMILRFIHILLCVINVFFKIFITSSFPLYKYTQFVYSF